MKEIAATKQVTPAQLALAWLLAQGDDLVPIPGTKRRKNLEENVAALGILLTREDLQRIDEAAPKGAASGDRYEDMSVVERRRPGHRHLDLVRDGRGLWSTWLGPRKE